MHILGKQAPAGEIFHLVENKTSRGGHTAYKARRTHCKGPKCNQYVSLRAFTLVELFF